jgi:hypothetical protein
MNLDHIDNKILEIIHTYRNGLPVGFQTIDRLLLEYEEDFILNGLLGKKLDELTTKNLIHSPTEQFGYSLTEKGLDYIKSLSDN